MSRWNPLDLAGKRVGRWTVLRRVSGVGFEARCDCGVVRVVRTYLLTRGKSLSCGCFKPRLDIVGQRYGRFLVLGYAGEGKWLVRCSCGVEKSLRADHFIRGRVQSCGCMLATLIGNKSRVHGASESVEFRTWARMHARCRNPLARGFKNYGGRGITVCDRWQAFENFLADMGARPSPRHSLERRDVNGHYEPSNCVWATYDVQCNNKRTSHAITFRGETRNIGQWAELLGMSRMTILRRLQRGMSVEDALTAPVRSVGRRTYSPTGNARGTPPGPSAI